MKKKKGLIAVLITAALLFLTQGCYFGFGDDDWGHYHHYHGGHWGHGGRD